MRKRERIVRSFRLSSYYFFCCAVFFSSLFVVDMCVLCCGCRRFYTLTYYFIVVVVVVAVILISQRRAVKNFHFEFVFNFSISTPIDELRWATHGYRPPPSSSGTSNTDVSGVGFYLDFSTFWYRLCFGRVLFGVYCICAVVSIHPVGICARKVTLLRISENTQKKIDEISSGEWLWFCLPIKKIAISQSYFQNSLSLFLCAWIEVPVTDCVVTDVIFILQYKKIMKFIGSVLLSSALEWNYCLFSSIRVLSNKIKHIVLFRTWKRKTKTIFMCICFV